MPQFIMVYTHFSMFILIVNVTFIIPVPGRMGQDDQEFEVH